MLIEKRFKSGEMKKISRGYRNGVLARYVESRENSILEEEIRTCFFCWFFFLAALGVCCCAWAFSSCSKRGLLFVAVCRLLIAVASLVAEHGP